MALEEGQRFDCWEDFTRALEDWSIEDQFQYSVTHSDRQRKIIKCAVTEITCPFHLRASYSKRHQRIQIRALNARHTCLGTAFLHRPTGNRQTWLSRAVPNAITIIPSTTPAEIIAAVQLKYKVTISYDAADRARQNVMADSDDAERAQYQMLSHYLSNIKTSHPNAHVHLVTDDNQLPQPFEGLFICPPTSRVAFQFCRPFVALDGTFTKGVYKQVLLLAVGIDGENRGVVLAWGLVPSESERTGSYFMAHLKMAIPAINLASTTIISDRDKGLAAAGASTLSNAQRMFCTQHLSENVRKHYGAGASDIFRKVAGSVTLEAFEKTMEELESIHPLAHEYVSAIPFTSWAAPYVMANRYGHTTSNIVESINSSLVEDRRRAPLDLLSSIWNRPMDQRFVRHSEALKRYTVHDHLTQFGTDLFCQGLADAHHFRVQVSNVNTAVITTHGNV